VSLSFTFRSFGFACFSFFCLFVFVDFSFFPFSFSNSLGRRQCNCPIRSDNVFLSLSSPDSFIANSPIPDLLRSNALLEPNWRPLFHARNSASESDPPNVTAHEGRNASPAMNDVLPGTISKDRFVASQALASMRANSEFVSNEIDESGRQYEKDDKQRIVA
jgi:hypothetical protein